MNNNEARNFAVAALAHWGIDDAPRLIKNRENAVFEVRLPQGDRAALRLHRPGYQSDDSIRSELWWSEALVKAGLEVPLPYRTNDGDVLANVPEAGRVASLVSWTDGEPMGEADVPLSGSPEHQAKLHFALGAELARLHKASDAASLPDAFTRPVLGTEGLLGETPLWGRFWENAALSKAESDLLLLARERLQSLLSKAQSASDFGLIHADALRENVMVDGDHVRLIDFDDGAFGFRMYELGVAMSQNWDQPNRNTLGTALLEGYATERDLPANAQEDLEAFTVLRCLASCGWVIGRYDASHPATADYASRAVTVARRWMG